MTQEAFANVFQASTNPTELAFHARLSVTDAKLTVFAQPALTLKEDLNKTVTAQPVSLMMVPQPAKLATLFVKPAPTHQLVLHASLKTTELLLMANVSVPQDSIKSLTRTTLSAAEDAVKNAKNVVDQTFA